MHPHKRQLPIRPGNEKHIKKSGKKNKNSQVSASVNNLSCLTGVEGDQSGLDGDQTRIADANQSMADNCGNKTLSSSDRHILNIFPENDTTNSTNSIHMSLGNNNEIVKKETMIENNDLTTIQYQGNHSKYYKQNTFLSVM